jgi:tetratricopeptide (TPR) repeat protein
MGVWRQLRWRGRCEVRVASLPSRSASASLAGATGRSGTRLAPPVLYLVATVLILIAGACRSSAPADAPPAVTIKPIALPNLASASAPLQQLVRERHAAAERAGLSPAPDVSRAKAFGELGMVLMAAEYFREAEDALQNAETLGPGELRWPYYLGHLYRRTGDSAKATAAFERAVKADPTYPPAMVWLGNSYLEEGRPDAADPLYEKALARDPGMVAALLGRGRAALARNDYATAIAQLERALTIEPDANAVHVPLALAYRGAGQPEKAKRHLRPQGTTPLRPPDPLFDEIDLLLETPVAFELRGARAMVNRRFPEAIEAFQKGVTLAPDEPALRHKLATALALNGDLQGALTTMRETVRRSPDFAKGHYSLGLLYLQASDGRRAAAAFQDALRVEETYVEPRLQLAHLLRRTGQSPAALPHYLRLIELDPRVVEARFGAAMALVDVGRFTDARDQLVEGSRMFPDRPGFALALGRILAAAPDARARDGQRALTVMQSLPEPAQHTFEYGMVTAMALAETGRFDEAVSLQQQILEQIPPDADPPMRQRVNDLLRSYRQRQPARQPWARGEPMELIDIPSA